MPPCKGICPVSRHPYVESECITGIIQYACISFYFRNVQDQEAVTQLLKALISTNLLGVIITVYAGVTGIFVGFGWSDPIFFAVLTVLSFLQLKKYSSQ